MLRQSRASSCSVTALWRASRLAVLLALLAVLVPLVCAAPARADVMLDVVNWNQYTYTKYDAQNPYNAFCFATALSMVGNYYGGSYSTLGSSIDRLIATGLVRTDGYVNALSTSAIRNALGGNVQYDGYSGSPSVATIKSRLDAGYLCIGKASGHFYVIVGYIGNVLYINDPAGGWKQVSLSSRGYSLIGVDYFSGTHTPPTPPSFGGVYTSICTRLDRLDAGQYLLAGQYLVSQNGLAVLIMQGDGNLVLYGWGGVLWKSDTTGSGATRAVMQSDGNFVLYRSNDTAVWNSRTTGQGVTHVVVQDDGNFVAYTASGVAKWSTNTGGHGVLSPLGTHRLGVNTVMRQNQYMRSTDKRFMLLLQGDGNLVLYGAGGHALWSSGTTGKGATWAIMQSDGNFVLYTASDVAVWSTKTGGSGANAAILQNDGNFVLYTSAGAPKWDSKTGGRTSDESPPSTIQSGADSSWHQTAVTVRLSASDAGGAGLSGGPARTEFRLDAGAWTTGTNCTVPAPADHSYDGEHMVSYRSLDAAGNLETAKQVTVRIDTRAPAGSFLLAGGATTTASAAVSADSSVGDAHGPLELRFSTDGKASWSNWGAYAAAKPLTLPVGLGAKTVYAQYRDAAGNVLELSDAIELVAAPVDGVAPSASASGVAAAGHYRSAVAVTLTAADNAGGSGVASITYTLDGLTTTVLGASVRISVPAVPNGLHVLSYHATDRAANVGTEAVLRFTTDTLGPITAGKAASGLKGRAIVLRYKATDALSPRILATRVVVKNGRGVTVKSLALGTRTAGTWYSVRWTPTARGTYRYHVYTKDLAGNAQSRVGSARVVVR